MMRLLVASVVMSVACGSAAPPKTLEGKYRGDLAVVLVNQSSKPICLVRLYDNAFKHLYGVPLHASADPPLARGASKQFRLVADSYRLHVISCEGEREGSMTPVWSAKLPLTLTGPIEISVVDPGAPASGSPAIVHAAWGPPEYFGHSRSAAPAGPASSGGGYAPPSGGQGPSAPACLPLGSDCNGDHECCDAGAGRVACTNPLTSEGNPISGKTVCRRP